ncbi:MAG TPA: outer membrane beta-barrel protein [Bacteroidales bacterium]|nr:outer membrane beta-barrel protein [Bacteroidales bacterium]
MINPFQHIIRITILSIVLLGSFSVIGYSQNTGSCAEKLKNAESLFAKGQVEQVPSELYECMKSGFNREESLTAYKLLIQSYLLNDKLEMADSSMLAFLKKNPEYQVSLTDHSSFVHLFNNFRVKPVIQIAIHLGTNLPFITFVDQKGVDSEFGTSRYNTTALNLYTSIEAKIELNKKLEINVEAGYSQLSFSNIGNFYGFGETDYSESQKRIEIPVSVTYNPIRFGKFTPYGRLGFGPALNIGSIAKATFNSTDINNFYIRKGSDIDRKDLRIFMDIFAQVGAGIKFKTPGGYLFSEVRSTFGILNQTIEGGDSNSELIWHYFYKDNDFHINSLNFSVGYIQLFYKPSKLK